MTVFFDGSCIVCSREIDLYRQKPHAGKLVFVDISAEDFAPQRYGKTADEFMQRLHVRDGDGRFFTGVDAFALIWKALPEFGYRFLAEVVRFPGLHLLATLGYEVFARLRKYLPKRRDDCPGGTCHVGHPRP